MTAFHADLAWLPPGRLARDVTVVVEAGRIAEVREGAGDPGAEHLPGLVLPGLANAHSHAFHRALRGRTQRDTGGLGSFWTWREQMYAVAGRLDPDSYLALARATYGEMALAGITAVGEFHYLHHGPRGTPYDDPNAMGHALVLAAREAGLRLTLLDTCYLAGGIGEPLSDAQRRFGDPDADAWAARTGALRDAVGGDSDIVVGAAAHSVRAVPADQLATIGRWAAEHDAPLHAHVSEQRRENEACLRAYGVTPTRLLHDRGLLGPRSTAVHATHLTDEDIELLGSTGTAVCMCPTTERDLADGVGPAGRLREAGSPVTLGSDSHAVVDLLEEARAVELDERLVSQQRGHWSAAALVDAASRAGHLSLGHHAGVIDTGALADLVAVRLDSVRTAGGGAADALERVVFAGSAADVTDVVAGGRRVVAGGEHLLLGDVGRLLGRAVAAVV